MSVLRPRLFLLFAEGGAEPTETPLSETQRQDMGAAGDAQSPDAGEMGAPFGT